MGLSFEAEDIGNITLLSRLVKSFAVSFVICGVTVDNISIAVSLGAINNDQISFGVSYVVVFLENKSIAVSISSSSNKTEDVIVFTVSQLFVLFEDKSIAVSI